MPGTKRTAGGLLGGLLGILGLSAIAGVLIAATVTPAIAVTGLAAKSSISLFDSLPSALEIDKVMLPSEIYATDSETGKPLLMARFYEQNRSPVKLDEIAPVMIDALLSSEDNRFFQHGGADLQGTTRALLGHLTNTGSSGGSSISQQYVKNVLMQQCEFEAKTGEDDARQKCWREATEARGTEGIQRKLQEIRYAIALEQKYSKEDILLGYLNLAAFGGTTYGIDAAAKYYFDVSAKDLNLSQAATLAGMVQSPDDYRLDRPERESNGAANGYKQTKDRQLSVLYLMRKDGKITEDAYQAAVKAPIEPKITASAYGCATAEGAQYFCQMAKETILNDPKFGKTADDRRISLNRDGLKIYTTMDPRLQAAATQKMAEQTQPRVEGMDFGAAAVSVEVGSGKILAVAQNSRFTEDGDVVNANPGVFSSIVYASDRTYGDQSIGFEVGSTFKAFTLVDWLEKGHSLKEQLNGVDRPGISGTICGDDRYTWPTKVGNFNQMPGSAGTPMTFTRDSLNSGYAAMASMLSLCDIADTANRMGAYFGDGNPINMNAGPYTILGPANVSPVAMAGAYSTIANNGTYCRPFIIEKVVDGNGKDREFTHDPCRAAIKPEVAATAAFALEGVMTGNGTGIRANPGNAPVFGKTGTHEQRQTWMVESSTKVTTAVWVGNAQGDGDLWNNYLDNGAMIADVRYGLAESIQWEANNMRGGDNFPPPDENLNRVIYADLPSVVGMSVGDAQSRLEQAGFSVNVGSPVDGDQAAGNVQAQDPGAGSVAAGTTVTLSPSTGKPARSSVPNVAGQSESDAVDTLRGEGFTNLATQCKQDRKADSATATGTNPAAGSAVTKDQQITISITKKKC